MPCNLPDMYMHEPEIMGQPSPSKVSVSYLPHAKHHVRMPGSKITCATSSLPLQVDLERSMRDLEETECSLRESRLSLRDREEELIRAKEDLVERELENMRLSLDKMKSSPSVMR